MYDLPIPWINEDMFFLIFYVEEDFQELPLTPEEFGKLQKSEETKKIELEMKKVSSLVGFEVLDFCLGKPPFFEVYKNSCVSSLLSFKFPCFQLLLLDCTLPENWWQEANLGRKATAANTREEEGSKERIWSDTGEQG